MKVDTRGSFGVRREHNPNNKEEYESESVSENNDLNVLFNIKRKSKAKG